jgi:hypothetical protein
MAGRGATADGGDLSGTLDARILCVPLRCEWRGAVPPFVAILDIALGFTVLKADVDLS